MAVIRTVLLILSLLLGWFALRHEGLAQAPTHAPLHISLQAG